jgi:hypothetical protein
LVKVLKYVCSLVVPIFFFCSPTLAEHTIAVATFEDHSGFDGLWDLSVGFARLLSQRLDAISGYAVVEPDSTLTTGGVFLEKTATDSLVPAVVFFDSLRAGYLITGTVEDFGISRFGVVTPTLGGYQSYRAGVRVSFCLWKRGAPAALLSNRTEAEVKRGGLGLTLLGKPTDEMQQWEMLDALEFGSESYMATIIGGAVDTLLTEMIEKIQAVLPPQRNLESPIGPAVIVSADGDRVYINRGYDDGIQVGDRFEVYHQTEELFDPETGELLGYRDISVGLIRVCSVKSAHLSVAEVIRGEGEIGDGDEIR